MEFDGSSGREFGSVTGKFALWPYHAGAMKAELNLMAVGKPHFAAVHLQDLKNCLNCRQKP
jgi:hypothetical protein